MKKIVSVCLIGAVGGWIPLDAGADARLRVAVERAEVHARPEASSPVLASVPRDAVLFPSGAEKGGWTPVDPPADAALWVPGAFVDGTRVLAKTVQLRTGPGLEHDVAGTLSRGATVMRLGEEGEWLKIAPPSSAQVWVRSADVAPVAEPGGPIREVEAVLAPPVAAEGPPGPPSSSFVAGQTPPIAPSTPVADDPGNAVVTWTPPPAQPAPPPAAAPSPAPAPAPVPPPAAPPAVVHVPRPAPAPAPVAPPRPVARPVSVPASAARPPAVAPRPPVQRPVAAPAPVAVRPPVAPAAPAPNPALMSQLNLLPGAAQGRSVRVTGELRNAPFAKGTPSHFRLMPRAAGDSDCLVHGDPAVLRRYIGKRVQIRGGSYAVADADRSVVVPVEVTPLP